MERAALIAAIPHCLVATDLPLPAKYPGKVRERTTSAMAGCC